MAARKGARSVAASGVSAEFAGVLWNCASICIRSSVGAMVLVMISQEIKRRMGFCVCYYSFTFMARASLPKTRRIFRHCDSIVLLRRNSRPWRENVQRPPVLRCHQPGCLGCTLFGSFPHRLFSLCCVYNPLSLVLFDHVGLLCSAQSRRCIAWGARCTCPMLSPSCL